MATRLDIGRLEEGQVLHNVDLTQAEAVALNSSKLVSVQPSTSGWKVTAAYAVGAIHCGGLSVRVRPKIGSLQVLRLLARAYGVKKLEIDASLIGVGADPELTAVLAVLFAHEVATAMSAGVLRGYRTEDQTLSVLRGRLRLRDHQLRRFGMLVPLEVTFDEWTTDTNENRRIRAACRCLMAMADVPKPARDSLSRLDRLLVDAWLAPAGTVLAPWVPTRLNARLHRLLHLADLVLDHAAVENRVGDVQVHGFVLSMPWLFERLVTQLLDETGKPRRVGVRKRVLDLDVLRRLSIEPDLVFTGDAGDLAVADTKYKLLDENGRFPNADAYQLVTYCARLGLKIGHLIYAAGDPHPEDYEIIESGTRLVIHSVNMDQPVVAIEEQVRVLFDNIAARWTS
jgi:5-methylcytosine-specific restriction enzyme subunit McrC